MDSFSFLCRNNVPEAERSVTDIRHTNMVEDSVIGLPYGTGNIVYNKEQDFLQGCYVCLKPNTTSPRGFPRIVIHERECYPTVHAGPTGYIGYCCDGDSSLVRRFCSPKVRKSEIKGS